MDERLLKPYDPKETESKIYKLWEESGFFNPDVCVEKGITEKNAEPFTLIMPPTNANGSLHAGHGLVMTIEDIIIRYKRMKGFKTLWLPGADHAGFETQVVYNKKLEKEGAIKSYKAVFDYKKIDEGFCTYVLINLAPDEYGEPDRVGKELSKYSEIESIDICTGDWEMVAKVRVRDQNEYYEFLKKVISRKGVVKSKTLVSFKQIKSEFVSA